MIRRSMMFGLVFLGSVLAQDESCQGFINTNLQIIYPVNNEQFSLDLTGFFSKAVETYTVETEQVLPFTIQQAGVSSQVFPIFGTQTKSVLDVTGQTLDNNPNVPTGNYSFLVQNMNNSYQLVGGQTGADGSFAGQIISATISTPNNNCYTVNFPFPNQVLISCLSNVTANLTPVFYTNNFTSSQEQQPILTNVNNTVPGIPKTVLRVKSQVRNDPFNNETAVLVVGYFYNSSQNSNYDARLYFYNLTQTNSTFGGLSDLQSLNITYEKTLTYQNITDFYLSTDFTLFTLTSQGLSINNLHYNFTLNQSLPQTSVPTQQTGLAVFEVQNFPINGSYFISIGQGDGLRYYSYDALTGMIVFLGNNVTPFPISSLEDVYLDVQNSFLNPFVTVLALNNLDIFAASGPSFSDSTVLFATPYIQSVYTFDNQNSVIILASVQGVSTIQVGSPQLIGQFKLVQKQPSLTDNSLQTGGLAIKATLFNGVNCSLPLKFNVLQTDFFPAAFLITNGSFHLPPSYFIPNQAQETTTQVFYGPNLGYQFQQNSSVASSEAFQIQNIQLINQTSQNQSYPNNVSFIQNFLIFETNTNYIQVFQDGLNLNTSVSECNQNNCKIRGTFSNVSGLIQQMDVHFNQFESMFVAAIKFNTTDVNISIYTSNNALNWTLEQSIQITDFMDAPSPFVANMKLLQNDLYVVTTNPASVQVLRLTGNNTVTNIASLQGPNFIPLNLYVNEQAYGSVVFVDNTINLLECRVVFGGQFTILQTIPYSQLIAGQSVGVGLTNAGVYLAYTDSTLKNQLVQFIPRLALNTISSLGTQQPITLPLLDNQLTFPIVSTYTNQFFYVQGSTQVNNTFTALTYQDAPSSFNALYIAPNYTNLATSYSAVNSGQNNAIAILSQNSTQSIIQSLKVFPSVQISFVPAPMGSALIQEYFSDITILSNNIIVSQITYNFAYVNSQLVIGSINETTTNLNLTTYFFAHNFTVYPPQFFTGQTIAIETTCSANCTAQVLNQMVQYANFPPVDNAVAFTTNSQNQTLIQNSSGVFQNIGGMLVNTTNFTAPNIFNCPLVFTDINTNQTVSVCNTGVFGAVVSVAMSQNLTTLTNNTPITLQTNVIDSGYYLNGFVVFIGGQGFNSITLSIYAVDYNTTSPWQLLFTEPISDVLQTSPISVSIGQNLTSLVNPVIGIAFTNNEFVAFQTIIFNVPFAGNASMATNLSTISLNSTSKTTNLISLNSTIFPTNLILPETIIIQFLQIDNSFQAINSSINFVPIILITSNIHYRFNLTFDNNNLTEVVFMCPYSQYGSFNAVQGASALNDILVVPYQSLNNITYGVYQSSNPMFGGNGSQVCNGKYNPNTSPFVPIIAGLEQPSNQAETLTAFTQVLSNGQIGTTLSQTSQSMILQLSPLVTFSVNVSNITDLTATQQVIVTASNYLTSVNVELSIDFNHQTSTPFTRPAMSGLEIGLIVGGFVILMGTLAFLFSKSTQSARYERENLIEV